MSNTSGFGLSVGQILVRLSPLVLLGLVALLQAAAGARGYRPYEVGSKAIVYDSRADGIVEPKERVRVVATMLEHGGGVVAIDCVNEDADRLRCLPNEHFAAARGESKGRVPANVACDTQLLAADAWEGMTAMCFERTTPPPPRGWVVRWLRGFARFVTGGPADDGRLRAESAAALLPHTRQTCPEAECLDVEHGGTAIDDEGDITLAEPHTDRVTTFRLGLRALDRAPKAEVMWKVEYSGRAGLVLHDVARVPGGGLIVAESSPTDPKASSVRLLMPGSAKEVVLVTGIYAPRPVGVWYSRDTQRVYVTDVGDRVQRWMYVERANDGWSTPRTFWTAAESRSTTARLRHLTTGWDTEAEGDQSREIVFAAGSDGLYVIDPAGLLLAKYALARPLSGIDWGRRGELFFSSGHYVGVLRVGGRIRPRREDTPAAPAGPPGTDPVTPLQSAPPVTPPQSDRPPENKPPAADSPGKLGLATAAAEPPNSQPSPPGGRLLVASDIPAVEQRLRVPPSALADACRLATEPEARSGGLPPGSNPWVGTDRQRISLIHVRIAGGPLTPDGPPLDAAATRRFMRRLADGISHGYTARYAQPDGQLTSVDGLLFGDRDDAKEFAETARKGRAGSVIIHDELMVASVRGGRACTNAVAAHLKSKPTTGDPK